MRPFVEIQQDIDAAETKIEKLDSKISVLESKIEDLEEEADEMHVRKRAIESRMLKLEKELGNAIRGEALPVEHDDSFYVVDALETLGMPR